MMEIFIYGLKIAGIIIGSLSTLIVLIAIYFAHKENDMPPLNFDYRDDRFTGFDNRVIKGRRPDSIIIDDIITNSIMPENYYLKVDSHGEATIHEPPETISEQQLDDILERLR